MYNIFDLLKFTSDVLTGISLFLIVYLLFIFLKIKKHKEIDRKKQITLDLCIKDNRVYENFLKNNRLLSKLTQINIEADSHSKDINDILSYFEKISIGVDSEVYDEEIIRSYYEKYFISFYKSYKYYMLDYRDKYKLPFLYIEYEKYVKKWSMTSERNRHEW